MSDDPKPWRRCVCVSRPIYLMEFAHLLSPADPYYDRCIRQNTQEDGLCDHCRTPQGQCPEDHPEPTCCETTQTRTTVPMATPCHKPDPVPPW